MTEPRRHDESPTDASALIQQVMTRAAHEAAAELEAIAERARRIAEQKAAIRRAQDHARHATDAALRESADELQHEQDSLNELTQEDMLRLQLVMDRAAKAHEALSNLLKKISETMQTITQNIK